MEDGDEWLAADKLEHLLACFLITVLVAALARRSRLPFVRRRSAAVGSLAALAAGAAKEAGDEFGFWMSSGASAKDAAADVAGVILAYLSLAAHRKLQPPVSTRSAAEKDGDVSMV